MSEIIGAEHVCLDMYNELADHPPALRALSQAPSYKTTKPNAKYAVQGSGFRVWGLGL